MPTKPNQPAPATAQPPLLAVPENSDESQTARRIEWLDIARGLGIILVVYGRAARGLLSAGVLTGLTWWQIDFDIYTFHMPLFLLLSGINTSRSWDKPDFLSRRAKSVLVPYLVFSLLQGSIAAILSDKTNGEFSLTTLLLIPIIPLYLFWFLYVLFLFFWIISLWPPGKSMLVVALAMLLLSPLLADFRYQVPHQILYFFGFFAIGVAFPIKRIPGILGVACLLFWAVWVFAALHLGVPPTAFHALVMVPATLAGLGAIFWMSQTVFNGSGVLSYLGRNAMGIYVMHNILATAGSRIILQENGVRSPAIFLIVTTISGIVLPLLALRVFQLLKVESYVGLPSK